MAAKRVLYICYDPTLLLNREQLLLSKGFDVVTALGTDGLMAQSWLSEYDLVLVCDGASLDERTAAIGWLREHAPSLPIVALCRPDEGPVQADYSVLPGDRNIWLNSVAEWMDRPKNTV